MLSDGAFALYMHLVVNADRRRGNIQLVGRDLARDVGKSLRTTMSYIEEMEAKQVCGFKPALNQHQPGEIEICDAFWPYVKQAAPRCPDELQTFIFDIKEFLRLRLCVTCRFSAADLSFAEKLHVQQLSIEQVRRGIILGCSRKCVSLLNKSSAELIARLSYFDDTIDEANSPEVFSKQWEIREHLELRKYETLWGAVRLASIADNFCISPDHLVRLLNLSGIEDAQAILVQPTSFRLRSEQAERLSCLIRIYNAAQSLQGKINAQWFKIEREGAIFGKSSPMKFMMDGGLKNLETVRRYLYTLAGL